MKYGSKKRVRKFRKWLKSVVSPKRFSDHFWRLAIIFAFFWPVHFYLEELISDNRYLKFFNLGEESISDLDYSDIYYQTETEDINFLREKKAVLINISDVPVPERREELVGLLNRLERTKALVIGVDMFFGKENACDSLLRDCVRRSKNIVFAVSNDRDNIFAHDPLFRESFGQIDLPDTKFSSVRNYYRNTFYLGKPTSSFAYALYEKAYRKSDSFAPKTKFRLLYSCINRGFYDIKGETPEEDRLKNFPSLSSAAFLDLNIENARQLVNQKAVIIGGIGQNPYESLHDTRDHYKVPTDQMLVNRDHTMPGAVIHANAYQQLSSGTEINDMPCESLFKGILLFLLLIFFYRIELFEKTSKVFSTFLLVFSTITICISLVYFSIWLLSVKIHLPVATYWLDIAALQAFRSIGKDVFEDIGNRSFNKKK